MIKKEKSFFEKFKNTEEKELTEMPPALAAKHAKYNILSGIVLVGGIIVCIVVFSGFSMIKSMAFPALISLLLFLQGYTFKRSITRNGYDQIIGICVDYKYINIGSKLLDADFSVRKQVNGLIVECEDKIVLAPVHKTNDVPPIGSKVILYLPKQVYERTNGNGVTVFSEVYGYEMVPDMEVDDESEEKAEIMLD